jgi:hypothetical protein
LKGFALSYVAMTLWFLGYPDQALKWANEAVEFTQTLSHPLSLAGVEFFPGVCSNFGTMREFEIGAVELAARSSKGRFS